jgi:hypothetical protein
VGYRFGLPLESADAMAPLLQESANAAQDNINAAIAFDATLLEKVRVGLGRGRGGAKAARG